MKKLVLVSGILGLLFSSCANADPKKMAADICTCMEPISKKLSPQSKRIVLKAFSSKDFQNVLGQELVLIENEAEKQKVSDEITAAGTLMQGKKLENCLSDIDKKYTVLKTQEKQKQKEIVQELEKQCSIGASMFKYALQHQDELMKAGNATDN